MMRFGYGMMGYGFGWLIMLGVVVLIVLGVVVLVHAIQRSGKSNQQVFGNHALSILNERFARGEISEEEYKSKKAQIQS